MYTARDATYKNAPSIINEIIYTIIIDITSLHYIIENYNRSVSRRGRLGVLKNCDASVTMAIFSQNL